MRLKKNTIVRFIYKGKQERFRIMFYEYYNNIPLYYSSDIEDTLVIKLEDDSIFIVANNNYKTKIGQNKFNLEVWHSLVTSVYNRRIADIYCAYWFNFQSVINMLKTSNKIDYSEKEKRITLLEKVIMNKDNEIKVETQESVLSNIKIVDVIGD